MLAWLIVGATSTVITDWVVRLEFERERITLGTLLSWLLGVAAGPITSVAGALWFLCWAFGEPDRRHRAVKWPLWWERFRYKQHRAVRWIWHLGSPPAQEDILSGWRDYKSEEK